MKKWLLFICANLMMVNSVFADSKIAIVNIGTIFQQVAQKTGISVTLEEEFRDRANELQRMENDLQSKVQRLQRDGSIMTANERSKLEKDVMTQRQALSDSAQSFEQDRQQRSNEERSKLFNYIQAAVKKVAIDNNIDLVIDINMVAFNSNNIKDITTDVLKQVK